MKKTPFLLINAILILSLFSILLAGSAEAITTSICSPKLTATYYVVPSTITKSICIGNDNANPATVTLSASSGISSMIVFSQTQVTLAPGETRFIPFNITVTSEWDYQGSISASYYVPQDPSGFPNMVASASLTIKKGTAACAIGQTQACNASIICPGIQNCTNYQWAACVKTDPLCGTNITCPERWNCTAWSACANSVQTRSCADTNSCNTTYNKPIISQTCSTNTTNTTNSTCTESWSCGVWSACANSTQTRNCADANSCNTTLSKPSVSQTCSMPCIESWSCTAWGECQQSSQQSRTCADVNSCNTTMARPALTQNCTFTGNPVQCKLINPLTGGIYTLRSQYLAINCSVQQRELKYFLNSATSTLMCTNCTKYNRSVSLVEGRNNLTILSNNSWNQLYSLNASFIIDSTYPTFWKSTPTGSYLNKGMFSVNYTETNPKKVTLYYREAGKTYQMLERTDCPGGNYQACGFSLNLTPFDGKSMNYLFSIQDIAGNARNYTTYTLKVDITKPVLTIRQPFKAVYNTSSALFNISVSENVSLKYRDFATTTASNQTLCSLCDKYAQSVSFSQGFHNITIYAVDQTGNTDEKSASFFVDYTAPQISAVLPTSGYASGIFNITYTEANCQLLTLKVTNGTKTKEQSMPCASGTSMKMSVPVNMTEFEGKTISYTFTLKDIANSTKSSAVSGLSVDMTAPVIKQATTTLKARNLYWNITLDTSAKYIKYIDHKATYPSEKYLCTACADYGFKYAQGTAFPAGFHNVSIIAEDSAGNRAKKDNILFTVI